MAAKPLSPNRSAPSNLLSLPLPSRRVPLPKASSPWHRGSDLKKQTFVREAGQGVSSTPVFSLLVDALSLSFQVVVLYLVPAELDCVVVLAVVASASAHGHHDWAFCPSPAATRTRPANRGVSVPEESRTTQLYRHENKPRRHTPQHEAIITRGWVRPYTHQKDLLHSYTPQ